MGIVSALMGKARLAQTIHVVDDLGAKDFLVRYDSEERSMTEFNRITSAGQIISIAQLIRELAKDKKFRQIQKVNAGVRNKVLDVSDLRILDIGCGGCESLQLQGGESAFQPWAVRFWAHAGAARVVGVDNLPDVESEYYPVQGWEFANIDITDPDQLDRLEDLGEFDLVTCTKVISLKQSPDEPDESYADTRGRAVKAKTVVSPTLRHALDDDWDRIREVANNVLRVTERITTQDARIYINAELIKKGQDGKWDLKRTKHI